MEGQIEDLKLKKPKFISAFEIESISNSILPKKWNQSEFFTTKKVCCSCGQKQQHLLSTPIKEMKGLFKKREVLNHLAPIHIRCSACNKTNLLLNPEIHGWSGELKESAAMIGKGEPQLYSDSPGEYCKLFLPRPRKLRRINREQYSKPRGLFRYSYNIL